MLRTISLMLALVLALPSGLAPARANSGGSAESVLGWINQYRFKPEPNRVPEAIRTAGRAGAFKDPESAGAYVGFLAGVLNANPKNADALIGKILPMPAEQQWAIVRAIAYSGLPNWKDILRKYKAKMAGRETMIDMFIAGNLPTLGQLELKPEKLSWFDRLRGKEEETKKGMLEPTPDVIDTLWGFYFATGTYEPIRRIIAMLPWSKEEDEVERLTLGGMAKYTLATNASRNADLLNILKWAEPHQDKATAAVLKEVILAAETVETAKLRKEALASIEQLKRKGPGYKRKIAGWGQVGQGALSLGCIGAAVAGAVVLGLPCVIGGAVSSAALNAWAAPD
jgi:hypothetical protein